MKIEIEDHHSAEYRVQALEWMPVLYAMRKFKGNRRKAMAWLGMSVRSACNIIRRHEQLQEYRQPSKRSPSSEAKLHFMHRRTLKLIIKNNRQYLGTTESRE